MTSATIKPLPLADLSLPEPKLTRGETTVGRLVSLDVFRGLTIAFMLLVNNPGDWSRLYWPLAHAPWHGCTPCDLVFPFFLFIVGAVIPFSQAKRAAVESKREQLWHILSRALTLILLGILLAAIPSPPPVEPPAGFTMLAIARFVSYIFVPVAILSLLIPWRSNSARLLVPPVVAMLMIALIGAVYLINRSAIANGLPADFSFGGGMLNPYKMRWPGVLQRIGICYAVAATIALFAGWRSVLFSIVLFLAAYSFLMLKVPYPSLEQANERVVGKLQKNDNLARFVDERVFGTHAYRAYPDPEGLISTLPAIGTTLLGVLAGFWLLRRGLDETYRCAGLLVLGAIVTCLGWALAHALMPLNKQIWTPSYAVYTAGLGMLGLGLCFWFVDILGWRRATLPLRVYGMNAIAAFVLAGVVARLMSIIKIAPASGDGNPVALKKYLYDQLSASLGSMFGADAWITSAYNLSLAWALSYVITFLILMWVLYALRIFVKV